ncbi:glycosyltransferase [Aeromicrobium yanjiei]|uniref:Glycosyltransferase n=2 Tax=Aeromicrobium yanjiei TaxID=2662028 RepID=A0A5Q2MIA7_9ACTN|nr:glycosyltransferase [Aeromicrobium yanjiei]
MSRGHVLVALGAGSRAGDAAWMNSGVATRVIHLDHAAPSGRRLRSRILGMGIDSLLIALKTAFSGVRGPVLAANPWVGVSLRLLGWRHVSVTGIYAEAGSRNHRVLRRLLGSSSVVTMVESEARSWREAGGRAIAVRYGNTLQYPPRVPKVNSAVRIFVGGSSDRDHQVLEDLIARVQSSQFEVHLTITLDEQPASWSNGSSTITRTGRLTNSEFGAQMSQADVVFLPLVDGSRAAGHMVAVGALETGAPVITTRSGGMDGYVDGTFVATLDEHADLLDQLVETGLAWRGRETEVREHWAREYSLEAYVVRVGEALSQLEAAR